LVGRIDRAWPKNAKAALEEAALDAVPLNVLRGKEAHERLLHCAPDAAHAAG
jgi:hypothetical protein